MDETTANGGEQIPANGPERGPDGKFLRGSKTAQSKPRSLSLFQFAKQVHAKQAFHALMKAINERQDVAALRFWEEHTTGKPIERIQVSGMTLFEKIGIPVQGNANESDG